MAKQTKEFTVALFKTGNSAVQALADGKLNFSDITYFFDDIPAWELAVEGFNPFAELATATNAEMEAIDAANGAELSAVNEEDKFDAVRFAGGIASGIRFIARKSFNAGRASVIAELEAQDVDCSAVK